VGVAVTDILTGMYATVAILAALRERDGCADAPGSGMGQHLDMALLDSGVALLANLGMSYLVSGQPPGRAGNAHQNIVPYQVFAVRDGHIIVTAGNDGQFAALCRVLDCTALATDLRFATNAARVRHRETLLPLLTARIAAWEGAALLAALDSAGVPCGPINRLDQVFADPQVVARDLVRTLPHPLADSVRVMASPLRLSDTPVVYRCAPPLHGEHTDAVLRDILGRSAEEIADLRKRAVIGTPATASADRVRDGDINPP
jgi:crotonobetainyl-CoA:carnitine CoA-transferase CaiB-like acyl-CoA transferase